MMLSIFSCACTSMHTYLCIHTVCMSSLKGIFRYLPTFKLVLCFLIVECSESFVYLRYKYCIRYTLCKYFLPIYDLPFIHLAVPFAEQFLILMKSNLSFSFFINLLLMVYLKLIAKLKFT